MQSSLKNAVLTYQPVCFLTVPGEKTARILFTLAQPPRTPKREDGTEPRLSVYLDHKKRIGERRVQWDYFASRNGSDRIPFIGATSLDAPSGSRIVHIHSVTAYQGGKLVECYEEAVFVNVQRDMHNSTLVTMARLLVATYVVQVSALKTRLGPIKKAWLKDPSSGSDARSIVPY